MIRFSFYLLLCANSFFYTPSFAQNKFTGSKIAGKAWVDSVFKSLSHDEQIAQLMVVRLSTYDAKNKTAIFYDQQVDSLVKQYNIGGICLFQGSPVKQATILNHLQSVAKTPILMCIDAEWGVGMRMIDSVLPLPHQMMLGAVTDASIAYQYGQTVAEQCKRVGIQVNYAPVVDVNNNPNNPVINDRSFGEDKYKVALFGTQYMKGMQDMGVMACAKHFPGHGDVSVDSHYDLPVINKSMAQLDSLELYPFREIFKAGISSVMIAHLFIPAIDNTPNRATSISKNNVTGLMRNQLGYQGLTFTDALEMQGVKKFFPDGEASVQSLIAGNDMLCLPGDVSLAIEKIKAAINYKKLSWEDIEKHCRRVLMAKYEYGLTQLKPINTENLTVDLNSKVPGLRKLIAENALTVLNKTDDDFFALKPEKNNKPGDVVLVGIGISADNGFAKRLRADYNADVFYFNNLQDASRILSSVYLIKNRYKKVIIGVHAYKRTPANNFGISPFTIDLIKQLQEQTNAATFVFGNPYAIKNFCGAKNLVACFEDDDIIQNVAADLLQGKISAKGKLPVTVCDAYPFGSGIITGTAALPKANPADLGMDTMQLNKIDSIAKNAISKGATPGCVVLVVKDGKIAYHKAFGSYSYDNAEPVTLESVYDMASVTKICATTISIMKLYEQGKIDLKKTLGDYLPMVRGSNKANLLIENVLLHQAGLVPYIPFYKETIDASGVPFVKYYSTQKNDSFKIRVADNLFLRNDWNDTMYQRIIQSPLTAANKYVYSDNDFIYLGKIVEAISGLPLNEYAQKEFYTPLGLTSAGFRPRERLPLNRIAPTENEKLFRKQLIRGDVHDPGAAMFGGVAGHAGLFSNAYDIAVIMQMLMNGGEINGQRYLRKETVDLFTAYHSNISRRGFGFDKPEKDNNTRPEPYPCLSASPLTFGHTGFTGTCTWADPAKKLVYVFLSNRVNPDGENPLLGKMNVRPTIHETIYKAIASGN
jgi:beta-glucosidase-like glycosyl hydrolase/CubicO group peptidase (beta-lactamase class C family)